MAYSFRYKFDTADVDSNGYVINISAFYEMFDPDINDGKTLKSHPVIVGLDEADPGASSYVSGSALTATTATSWVDLYLGESNLEIYRAMMIKDYENPETEDRIVNLDWLN